MRKIISISEVVGSHEVDGGTWEVCAAADAEFDEAKSQLIVELDSCVRTSNLRSAEERSTPAWLPRRETVKESVPLEEAMPTAKDIFQSWARKVRQSIPSLINR